MNGLRHIFSVLTHIGNLISKNSEIWHKVVVFIGFKYQGNDYKAIILKFGFQSLPSGNALLYYYKALI